MMGALIGASVALLFAPQPGTELRGRLDDYINRVKEDLEKGHEAWDTVVERGEDFYEQGGGGVVRDGGRSAEELAKHSQDRVREPG